MVSVVGQSLEDRDETLANLVASFAIGGPIAIVLASLLGYALANAGLRPVEAMRRRAAGISLDRGAEELPLPRARDEIRRLAETLNEMLARLRGSFERERRFVADASHDLRNPIAVIRAELDAALARRRPRSRRARIGGRGDRGMRRTRGARRGHARARTRGRRRPAGARGGTRCARAARDGRDPVRASGRRARPGSSDRGRARCRSAGRPASPAAGARQHDRQRASPWRR